MSSIKIHELCPTGYDLFQDSESFLSELTDSEMVIIDGGRKVATAIIVAPEINVDASFFGVTVFTANGNSINANTVTNVNTFASVIG